MKSNNGEGVSVVNVVLALLSFVTLTGLLYAAEQTLSGPPSHPFKPSADSEKNDMSHMPNHDTISKHHPDTTPPFSSKSLDTRNHDTSGNSPQSLT